MNKPIVSLQLPKVIAHRGASHYAPENTLAAFRKAHTMGATWIEFDVMLTADDELVVIHNETLERTTNGHGEVAKTTLANLQQLDAGSWFSSEFAGEKIPMFSEALTCAKQLGLGINVEIKAVAGQQRKIAEKVVAVLQQQWPKNTAKLLVSSFSWRCLEYVRELDPTIPLGLLLRRWKPGWRKIFLQLQCVSLHLRHNIVKPTIVAELKKQQKYVVVYTVNDPQQAKSLYALGVDAVFSDMPDLLLK